MTTYLVGLDGADWDLLRKFVDNGHLPTFERILNEGVSGDLKSCYPPITCPAWQCYATGKDPGKLGVYGWMWYDDERKDIGFNTGESFVATTYFELLAESGRTVGVVNMPTTYPGDRYDDIYLVPGPSGTEDERFTNPPELREELEEVVPNYSITPETEVAEAPEEDVVEMITDHFHDRFEAVRWLRDEKECDFLHVTLFATDTMQHYYWDQPGKLREMYEYIDTQLEILLNQDDTEAVFLLSDHGFGQLTTEFSPNEWLVQRSDLSYSVPSVQRAMAETGVTRGRLKDLLLELGVLDVARALVPASLRRRFLPNDDGSVDVTNTDINWDETRAIHLGHGPVYLNADVFESDEAYQKYTQNLKEALHGLETDTGEPLVAAIHDTSEIYSERTGSAPDFQVEYTPGVDASNVDVNGPIFGDDGNWSGAHRQYGIFAAYGTDIDQGVVDISLVDMAPTILHHQGERVPEDMDGEVKREVLAGQPLQREVEQAPPTTNRRSGRTEAGEDVEERLESLGYIG